MKLPFFTKQKKIESEFYLALLLTEEKALGVILKEEEGKLSILNSHEEFLPESIETLPLEDLINVLDKTISIAEEVLPPNIETHKTVFGLKEAWIEKETKKITKEYLAKLKKVCDALDLKPIGFMVVNEAISHFLQKQEGAPLSAILAEVGKKQVSLFLFRGGKVVEQIADKLTKSAPETVDSLLKHFTTAVLPARLIIYDSNNTEKLSQQFIHHQWSKSLPFLHVPQVTVLDAGFDGKAVAAGAAEQMGFTLEAGATMPQISKPEQNDEETSEGNSHEPMNEEKKEEQHKKEESEQKNIADDHITADNFGFVMDEDITKLQPQKSSHHETEDTHHQLIINEPIHPLSKDDELEYDNERPKKSTVPIMAFLSKMHIPKLKFPRLPVGGGKPFMIPLAILGGLVVLIGGLIYFYLTQAQAHITIFVKPTMVDQTQTITFSESAPNNFSKNTIAGTSISTTVEGKLTANATGKKDIGDKAKGTVTIYNNDTDQAKLTSGTTIKSSNGIIFTIDKDITVASASGDIFSGTKPGTTNVDVIAEEIGTEGNLPSGTKFSIGSNSSLAAKNDSAFSDGTKKQVTIVSKQDIANLQKNLPKELETQAKDKLNKETAADETVLPIFLSRKLKNSKVDHDVNDEAKSVTLTAQVVFDGLAYNNNNLKDYVKVLLKEHMKKNKNIAEDKLKISVENPDITKNGDVTADVNVDAGLLPTIETTDVIKSIQGKSLSEAKDIIGNFPQVTKSEFTFSPFIPFIPNIIPWLPKQITVEFSPE